MIIKLKQLVNDIFNYLHHKLTNHCDDCLNEAIEAQRCKHCETYLNLLEIERKEKQYLLDKLLAPRFESQDNDESNEPVQIKSRTKPWYMKQRELELADKVAFEKAGEIRKNASVVSDVSSDQTIAELENELGVG